MDFFTFYGIGADVVQEKDISRSTTLARLRKDAGKNVSWKVLQILALKHCYLALFPPLVTEASLLQCVNDNLLDLDPVRDYSEKELIVIETRGSTFCFRLEELLSIFHNDLSRSVLEYEPQYHILTLTKAFRLPTHPYLQEKFTKDDISQMVHQMILKFDTLPLDYPEVYLFLRNADLILDTCPKKSNYDITTCLETYFESQQSRYIQKFTVKTRENQSYWDTKLPKRVKTEKQMYLWFLETMFATKKYYTP